MYKRYGMLWEVSILCGLSMHLFAGNHVLLWYFFKSPYINFVMFLIFLLLDSYKFLTFSDIFPWWIIFIMEVICRPFRRSVCCFSCFIYLFDCLEIGLWIVDWDTNTEMGTYFLTQLIYLNPGYENFALVFLWKIEDLNFEHSFFLDEISNTIFIRAYSVEGWE